MINNDLEPLANLFLEEMEDDYVENPLISREQHELRKRLSSIAHLDLFLDEVVEGLFNIYEQLPKLTPLPGERLESIPSLKTVCHRLRHSRHQLKELIDRGIEPRLRNLMGFTDEMLGQLYQGAIFLLEGNSTEKAVKAIRAITALEPYVGFFWLAYGEALVKRGNKEEAIDAFQIASYLSPLDSIGYVRGAELALELSNSDLMNHILTSGRLAAGKYFNNDASVRLIEDLDTFAAFLNGGG